VLNSFLNAKPLYYDEIDYTRMPRIYESVKNHIKIPHIIHIIGTNGKGTTGRFLASAISSLGISVGHYSSPHIVDFNERIWLDGSNIATAELEVAHKKLLSLLSGKDAEALSYFEYTTLLAMIAYEACEYIVLEAGLGGEHDATAVFENELTLVTPIGKDHEAFLGDTIEEISQTKLNAVRKKAILAKQVHKEVYEMAQDIAQKNHISIEMYDDFLEKEDYDLVDKIGVSQELSNYLKENLLLSISALKALGLSYTEDSFLDSRLFGRLSKFRENILLDVGHNTLAAQKIYESLKQKKYILVYNSYKDKDYKQILEILKPIILDIEIIDIEDSRIESDALMKKTVENLGFKYKKFEKIESSLDYLVFGSFSVVEAFIKGFNE